MLEGKCPKCGITYYGWSLRFPRNQYCNECGTALEIKDQSTIIRGYSPFEAEEYRFPGNNRPADHKEITKNHEKN